MKTSLNAKDIMKKMESLALLPYDDQVGVKPAIKNYVKGATIGYGHLISQAEWYKYKNGISEKDADFLFDSDLAPFEKAINELVVSKKTLKQNEFDALIMLVFNIGVANFRTSSVLKFVLGQPSSYSSLQSAWGAWNKSQGKVMNGLTKRRALEYKLYTDGLYQYFK